MRQNLVLNKKVPYCPRNSERVALNGPIQDGSSGVIWDAESRSVIATEVNAEYGSMHNDRVTKTIAIELAYEEELPSES